jgi:hypothetical protein
MVGLKNNELERIWKEAFMVELRFYSTGWTKENNEKCKSVAQVFQHTPNLPKTCLERYR